MTRSLVTFESSIRSIFHVTSYIFLTGWRCSTGHAKPIVHRRAEPTEDAENAGKYAGHSYQQPVGRPVICDCRQEYSLDVKYDGIPCHILSSVGSVFHVMSSLTYF